MAQKRKRDVRKVQTTSGRDLREQHRVLLDALAALDRVAVRLGIDYYLAYGSALGAIREGGPIAWDPDIDVMVRVADIGRLVGELHSQLDPRLWEVHHVLLDPDHDSLVGRIGPAGMAHSDMHVDIFPIAPAAGGVWRRNLQRRLSWLAFRAYRLRMLSYPNILKYGALRAAYGVVGHTVLGVVPRNWLVAAHRFTCALGSRSGGEYVYNACGSYGRREIFPAAWLGEPRIVAFGPLRSPVPSEAESYLTHFYGQYMKPVIY